jgi:hypothetical protein
MKARFPGGAGPNAFSGSIGKQHGGTTFSKNHIVRERIIPVNPRSTLQSTTRAIFTFLTGAWASLTEAQRLAWESAKALPYYFVPDGFFGGTKAANSGKDLFVQVNYNLNQVANTLSAPTIVTTDPAPNEPSDTIGVTSLVFDDSANTAVLTYTGGALSNEELVVQMTPPVSAGTMRLTSVASFLRDSPSFSSASPATVTKPAGVSFTGATGQKVFWVVQAINSTSGKKRIIASGNTVVTA